MYQSQYTVPKCETSCFYCLRHPNPRIWVHKSCCDVLAESYGSTHRPTFDDLEEFAKATKALYKPSDKDKEERDIASVAEGLFSIHTRDIIEDCARQELLETLPAEILGIILTFIGPCWYLIVLGESRRLIEQLRNSRGDECEPLSLLQDVYITRIEYQGISYLSRLSNTPLPSQDFLSEERLLPPLHVQKIILSTDHIGIRGIQLLDWQSDPSLDSSPWHKIVEARLRPREIEIVHHVNSFLLSRHSSTVYP